MNKDDLLDTIEVPAGLESRLEILIDHLAETEKQNSKIRRFHWQLSGLAAGIALLLSIGIFLHSNNSENTQLTAQATALSKEQELACLEAQKALILVSQNFNKGMDHLALVVNEIEKSNNTINKTLKK